MSVASDVMCRAIISGTSAAMTSASGSWLKTARRVLEDTPWPVPLALLVTVGLGIFLLLSRKEQATSQRIHTRQTAGNLPRHRTRPRSSPSGS